MLQLLQVFVTLRSCAKLLGVDCISLKRLHHCQPLVEISHIKQAAVEMAKNYGIELFTMMEQYCLSFNFKPYNLCRTKGKQSKKTSLEIGFCVNFV